ncbi:MAG TPA: AAA family ATPase [Verrucomicrobiae bacterium]|jgi:SpoVK/Ycf46/Vps4 family AAA+-type ATPase|nr:AAA family ATPase [Verrucomicrobiae bacterium]
MNDQTLKLLEKALQISPGDWETRAHLIDAYLAVGQPDRAAQLLQSAPQIPDVEADALRKARVELETDLPAAQMTLERILARNKACAEAYLLFAKVFEKRGLRDEARKKYGAATIIDETLHDTELEAWLGSSSAPSSSEQPTALPDDGDIQQAATLAPPPATPAVPDIIDAPEPQPPVTFDDVGGMEDVIERIRMNIIYPFKNPEVFKKFKKKPGGGILLYGPPGCGKTHIARATAGECGAAFMAISITDILSKWLGESEQRLHQLFEQARRRSPTVIFIDEVDAIGGSRGNASASMAPIVNVFLTEMDGMAAKNENLMVLAATNTPWRVDDALRRPGRFDRILFVPPPDVPAREAILKIHLRDLPVEKLEIGKLAQLTNRFSGADLRAAVERASEKAIYQEMQTGRPAKLTQSSLVEVIKEMNPSTNEWLETARSYASYANRSGLYDDLVEFFEKGK